MYDFFWKVRKLRNLGKISLFWPISNIFQKKMFTGADYKKKMRLINSLIFLNKLKLFSDYSQIFANTFSIHFIWYGILLQKHQNSCFFFFNFEIFKIPKKNLLYNKLKKKMFYEFTLFFFSYQMKLLFIQNLDEFKKKMYI